jgi:hypothetical protein
VASSISSDVCCIHASGDDLAVVDDNAADRSLVG